MPSTKRIVEALGPAIAHEYGEANVRPIASMMKHMMDNAHTHNEVDHALDTISDLLHAYGVEAIRGPYVDGYYMDINLLYVNMGSFDVSTIIFDTQEHRWYVADMETMITSKPKRFNV